MALRHFFNDEITILSPDEKAFGERGEMIPRLVRGSFNYLSQLKTGQMGQEVVGKAQIFFPAGTEISIKDRVLFDGKQYAVFSVEKPADKRKIRHLEVIVR